MQVILAAMGGGAPGTMTAECAGALAAAMARGSFSGLERLMVMSRSPNSVEVTHFTSRAMR